MSYVPIPFVKYQRVTHQNMGYIQTQYLNCERIRALDEMPSSSDSHEGDVVYNTDDNRFYGYNGTSWVRLDGIEDHAHTGVDGSVPIQVTNIRADGGESGDFIWVSNGRLEFAKSQPYSDKTYVHVQDTPSERWLITHPLQKYPSVTVVDSGGNTVFGDVQYQDKSNIVVDFRHGFSGRAYLN